MAVEIDQNKIMSEAIEKAGELLHDKPLIAEIILKQVIKCDPEHLAGLQLLGLCKHRLGENAEAVEIIQTALDLDPDNSDNWNNIGLAYAGLGENKRAVEAISKAIELKPDQFLFKNNLALQYRLLKDYDKAIKLLEEAIAVEERPQLWLNLGGLYGEVKDLANAEKCFKNALRLNPEYPAAYIDLAFCYFLKGDWKNGFAAYEWRFWYYPQMNYYLNSYDMNKVWNGKDDLNGKRVLVYGEQGLGDIIQFSRYCKELKNRGAYVIVHCPLSLDRVIKRIEGVDETNNRDIVNNKGPEFPPYDYQFSMMSFPYLLDVPITGEPYIKPVTNSFMDYLKERYSLDSKSLNVGLVWAGSPAHPHDRRRSIPLKEFKSLLEMEGVNFFSLQMDTRKRQYGATFRQVDSKAQNDPLTDKFHPQEGVVDYQEGCENIKLVDLTKMIQDFEDTCTVLAGLDVLICCDTATAHMAGAMGKPVWVMVPYNPDWRWGLEGNTTPWYDSMRLFRQTNRDDWEEVLKRVKKELHETVLQNKR